MKRAKHEQHGRVGTREYNSWRKMKNRCHCRSSTQWKWYGGRGIKVCKRWRESFLNFIQDMGDPPTQKHTIDRIDPNGDYEPANCRWATVLEQVVNKRPRSNTVWLTYKGETLSATEWGKRLGRNRITIHQRIRNGWDHESALMLPPQCGVSPGGWRKLGRE